MPDIAPRRGAIAALLASAAVATTLLPHPAAARELAIAQGAITMHEAASGQRTPACTELLVEARDALDNHLISRTHPAVEADGTCRYALSVPAQSAVWLRLRAALVADARTEPGVGGGGIPVQRTDHRASTRSVQLRFTIISPNTYFFAPGEQKTVPLSY